MSDLRKNPTNGRWVLIRPPATAVEGAEDCPYCPGNEAMAPPEIAAYRKEGSVPDGPGWSVRVVPEVDPHFGIDQDLVREGVGMYDRISPRGASEIIVESPAHQDAPASLPPAQLEQVLWMYRDRLRDLKRDLAIRDILVTRRHPAPAGGHPHSRLVAIPIIFDAVRRRLRECREYYEYKRRCVYCDILHQDLADGERVVRATEHFVAVVPYASRVPLETWIVPRQHGCAYEEALTGSKVADLAQVLGGLFRALASACGDPAFEMTLYTSPNESAKLLPGEWATITDDFHWSIEVLPEPHRLSRVGGIYVNDTPPELGADRLRAAWRQANPG
jgi:UDPglucose--hexose-1-phosphate uridylyltransferase